MKRALVAGLCVPAFLGLGRIQPATPGQPDSHPAVGHPKLPSVAADWPKPQAEDVSSVDAIVKAFYATGGGAPGQSRDWDRYRSLFLPEARLIAVRPGPVGGAGAMVLTVKDFVEGNRKYLEKMGLFDTEIGRHVEAFANVAHVWSTFESRHTKADPQPYVRGINSIQLLKDGARWWIVSVYWDFEQPESPIPDKYLNGPRE